MYVIKQEHKENVLNFFKKKCIIKGYLLHDELLCIHICRIVQENGFAFVINKEHTKNGKYVKVNLNPNLFIKIGV